MTQNWTNLGDQVRKRRQELGWSQADLSAHGGPSRETVRMIEAGERENYRDATFVQLDAALGWVQGTAVAMRDGELETFRAQLLATPTTTRDVWLAWSGVDVDRALVGVFETELGALRALLGTSGEDQEVERREVQTS